VSDPNGALGIVRTTVFPVVPDCVVYVPVRPVADVVSEYNPLDIVRVICRLVGILWGKKTLIIPPVTVPDPVRSNVTEVCVHEIIVNVALKDVEVEVLPEIVICWPCANSKYPGSMKLTVAILDVIVPVVIKTFLAPTTSVSAVPPTPTDADVIGNDPPVEKSK